MSLSPSSSFANINWGDSSLSSDDVLQPSASGSQLPNTNSPPPGRSPVGGPSTPARRIPRLDDLFNFQIVVFQVEDALFQVLKNGFNVPGTIFEAMFALPMSDTDHSLLEGNSLENPIVLQGVKADQFRVFLSVLYPFISQATVSSYDDWVAVLHLATMWEFKEIRNKAINALSNLIKDRPVPERIILGRDYHVVDWLRDEYIQVAQRKNLKLEELCAPSSLSLDWETAAKIFSIRETSLMETGYSNMHCSTCSVYHGPGYDVLSCRCRLSALINQVFRTEFEAMTDHPVHVDPPLPGVGANAAVKGKKKKGSKAN